MAAPVVAVPPETSWVVVEHEEMDANRERREGRQRRGSPVGHAAPDTAMAGWQGVTGRQRRGRAGTTAGRTQGENERCHDGSGPGEDKVRPLLLLVTFGCLVPSHTKS